MDKEIREWTVYTYIDNYIKNMLTSLRALIELRNPAMKERHWKELMELTNVMFLNLKSYNKYLGMRYKKIYRLNFLLKNRQH